MERFNKKLLLIIMMLGIFLLTGCGAPHTSDKGSKAVTAVPNDNQDNKENSDNVTPTTIAAEDDPLKQATPVADKELPIYTVDTQEGSGNVIPKTATIPADSDITPQLIVDKVVEALADQSITIGYDSVTTEGDAVIVSFKKDEAPYQNMGSEYEENILNAFAQSLIDNLKDYSKVIFRIEGKAYESGALEYDIDEPYMEK